MSCRLCLYATLAIFHGVLVHFVGILRGRATAPQQAVDPVWCSVGTGSLT